MRSQEKRQIATQRWEKKYYRRLKSECHSRAPLKYVATLGKTQHFEKKEKHLTVKRHNSAPLQPLHYAGGCF